MFLGRIPAALLTLALLTACIAPVDRRPGLWLPGEVAPFPSDWSFAKEYPLIAIEVRTPYLLRHSVTIVQGTFEGDLVVGARDPATKNWPAWGDDDPEVRLGIGDRVYEARLMPVTDEAEIDQIKRRALENSGSAGEMPEFEIRFWRVVERDEG